MGDTGMVTLTVNAATDNATITINIVDDDLLEQNETFTVSVIAINLFPLIISGESPLIITIVDNDALGKFNAIGHFWHFHL